MLAAALAGVLGAALLSGCSTSDADDNTLVVWSLEAQPDRMAATQRIAARFTQQTGIKVELVAVDENQFSQIVMSSAAADELPDAIGALPLNGTWQIAGNQLADRRAAQEVVDELGRDTFAEQALKLTQDGGQQVAVPSDGYAQLLVYRKDLFAKAGLPKPDTYQRILRAAEKLHRPGMTGLSMATSADDSATMQAFEAMALANDCELVNARGEVTVDSPQCKRTFEFIGKLASDYSAPGTQDIETTRATYFAGQSAMIMWSTHLLDELGGLRDDAVPSCPQCTKDREFLARNSGLVTAVQGPDAERAARFGELTTWTIPVRSKREQAKKFVRYMMSEQAYPEWLGMAPEGKIPARVGTRQDPDRFSNAWDQLPAGVDTKKQLRALYPGRTVHEFRDSLAELQRWAIPQREGSLLGAITGEKPISKAVNALTTGSGAGETAEEVAADIRSIQSSLN